MSGLDHAVESQAQQRAFAKRERLTLTDSRSSPAVPVRELPTRAASSGGTVSTELFLALDLDLNVKYLDIKIQKGR